MFSRENCDKSSSISKCFFFQKYKLNSLQRMHFIINKNNVEGERGGDTR